MSRGDTGFVWKNDVYARGSRINKEGMVEGTKKCMVCSLDIEATETCFYVFCARGTSAAQSRYVHVACEPQCRITPIQGRSACRVCGINENLDGCFRIPSRNIYYHQTCLEKAAREVVPEEEIKEKMQKRAEGRLKRGEVYYTIKINPYTGLELSRQNKGRYSSTSMDEVSITLRPLDGRLVRVSYDWCANLFFSGCWAGEEDVRHNCSIIGPTYRGKRPENLLTTLLKVLEDLRKHFDGRGRVIGERLDSDFKLRFVLDYGTSPEGAVNDPIR